jgi:hypothetical protein
MRHGFHGDASVTRTDFLNVLYPSEAEARLNSS